MKTLIPSPVSTSASSAMRISPGPVQEVLIGSVTSPFGTGQITPPAFSTTVDLLRMMNRRSSNAENADNERGAGIVEYVLVVGLIAIASLTAASALASSVSESMTNAAGAFGEQDLPVTQEKKVDAGKAGKVHFEVAGDKIRVASISAADGWTSKILTDNGTSSRIRFPNTESGDRVIVRGWINKKDKLKTKVVYK
jgi:Flp pilus assembly pilin Flp